MNNAAPELDDVKLISPPASLNKPLVREWVDALRSGKFTQTKGYLERVAPDQFRGAGHCCLGVLCAIVPGIQRVELVNQGHVEYDNDMSSLPPRVRDALGIALDGETDSAEVRVFFSDGATTSLAGLNDNHDDWTFDRIADLIERDWL